MVKFVSTIPWSTEQVKQLKQIAPDLDYVCAGVAITQWSVTDDEWRRDLPGLLAEVKDADIVVGGFGSTCERLTAAAASRTGTAGGGVFQQVMRVAPGVSWVHCGSAGVEKLFFPEFLASQAVMTCGKGAPVGTLLAESTMAMILAYTRGIINAVEQKNWAGARIAPRIELRGKTMGIVGFGGAGQALATRARAFEMDVIAIRRHPTPPPDGVRAIWGPERLHDLLRESDVVAITVPSTPETKGMIGLPEFQAMKRTAILTNIGRGDVIQPEALVTALAQKLIAFASLDVLPWPEPWGEDMPLWHAKNALITPHLSGSSSDRGVRNWDLIRDNFAHFVGGEPLESQVDRELRY